jgi:hypothetical protein
MVDESFEIFLGIVFCTEIASAVVVAGFTTDLVTIVAIIATTPMFRQRRSKKSRNDVDGATPRYSVWGDDGRGLGRSRSDPQRPPLRTDADGASVVFVHVEPERMVRFAAEKRGYRIVRHVGRAVMWRESCCFLVVTTTAFVVAVMFMFMARPETACTRRTVPFMVWMVLP